MNPDPQRLLKLIKDAAWGLELMGLPAHVHLRRIGREVAAEAKALGLRGRMRKRVGRGGMPGGRHGKPGPALLACMVADLIADGVPRKKIARALARRYGGEVEKWRRQLYRMREPARPEADMEEMPSALARLAGLHPGSDV